MVLTETLAARSQHSSWLARRTGLSLGPLTASLAPLALRPPDPRRPLGPHRSLGPAVPALTLVSLRPRRAGLSLWPRVARVATPALETRGHVLHKQLVSFRERRREEVAE